MVDVVSQAKTSRSREGARVRPFGEEDIPEVAELHRIVMRTAPQASPALLDEYHTYFREVFLDAPFAYTGIQSLVYTDETSRVVGFLGVAGRPLQFNGSTVLAGVCSQFVVDPRNRGFAGVALVRAAMSGPQDVLIADESNTDSRRIWEALGGSTALLYSTRWIFPLRPFRLALWAAGQRGGVAAVGAQLVGPVARLLDAVASRTSFHPYRATVPALHGEALGSAGFAACVADLSHGAPLSAAYDPGQWDWMLCRAERTRRHGSLHRVAVKAGEEIVGCYLYYLNRAGLSEVLRICADRRRSGEVLEHLIHHAWQRGAVALSGRAETALSEAFFARRCPFLYGPEWMLVHAKNPVLLQTFERGDASFSRLDGEWNLHFR